LFRSAISVDVVAALNPLSLPTNPDRAVVFSRARGTAPFFDPRLKLWIVLDPDAVTHLLQDGRLVMPDVDAALAALEGRHSIKLPNLRWATSQLPLLSNGRHHRRIRQPMAKFLSAEQRAPSWRGSVADLIASALAKPRQLEAFRELLLPVTNAVFESVTRVAIAFEPLTLSKIFDHYASLKHLVELEERVTAVRAALAGGGIPAESEGMLASLVMLGRDSLLSSISESFLNLATKCVARRLDDPPENPPALFSGVAIAERIARTPFTFHGVSFREGERLRLYFQGFQLLDGETARLGFFGSGPHSCLGRSLALKVWSLMVAEIAKASRLVEAVEFEYDRGVIFSMPKYIRVDLT
jgi:hypothetical protein